MDSWNTLTKKRSSLAEQSENGLEAMKKQLSDLGLYDEGMSGEQMRDTLKVVNDSKQSALESSGSQQFQELSEPSSPALISSQHQFSEIDSHVSPVPAKKTVSRDSTSPEPLSNRADYSNKSIQSTHGDSGNESNYGGQSRASGRFDLVRAHDKAEESPQRSSRYALSPSPDRLTHVTIRRPQSSQEVPKVSRNSITYSKVEKHLVDPLDCKQLENDLSLKARCLPPPRRREFNAVNGVLIVPEKNLAEMETFLTEQAELWHCRNYKSVYNDFRWGPPIKVGTANGSLDKDPVQEQILENEETVPQLRVSSVPSIREAGNSGYGLRMNSKKLDMGVFEFDENGSDDDFEATQKRKKTSKPVRKPAIVKRNTGDQTKKKPNKKASAEKEENLLGIDDFIDDSEEPKTTPKSRKRPPTPEYPEDSPSNSKKFATATRPKTLGPRSRNPLNISRSTRSQVEKPETPLNKPARLNDQEIEAALNADDDPVAPNSVKRPTKRILQGVEHLQKAKQEEKELDEQREKETNFIREQKNREQDERIRRRIKEDALKQQQKEAQEKQQKEKEERYRSVIIGTQIHKRTELESDEPRKRTILLDSDDNEAETETFMPAPVPNEEVEMFCNTDEGTPESIPCPICNELFTKDDIENHANNCFNYSIQEEGNDDNQIELATKNSIDSYPSRNKSCKICNAFTTKNNEELDKHVKGCIESLKNGGNENTSQMEASSSNPPDRNNKPASNNQTEREKSTKKTSPRLQNRKRKH